MTQYEISLVTQLLELQILDREARPVGRVDDVEIDEDGRTAVAILAGGEALAARLDGLLGRLWAAGFRRLHDDRRRTVARIPLANVRRVDSRVDLAVAREELSIGRIDEWLNAHLIQRIPGSDHAPE